MTARDHAETDQKGAGEEPKWRRSPPPHDRVLEYRDVSLQSIREEYHKRRNEEVKAEYERTKKQKEKEAAKGG